MNRFKNHLIVAVVLSVLAIEKNGFGLSRRRIRCPHLGEHAVSRAADPLE